jgi:hypothetical protein
MTIAASARLAVLSFVMFLISEIQQGIEASRGRDCHAAAMSAVSTVWAPARDELFPAKTAGAVAASAGFHEDSNLIDEGRHRGNLPALWLFTGSSITYLPTTEGGCVGEGFLFRGNNCVD